MCFMSIRLKYCNTQIHTVVTYMYYWLIIVITYFVDFISNLS